MASWRSTGASGQLQAVVTDITIASQAATSLRANLASGTAVAALRSATTALGSSAQAAAHSPIPGCVAGAHQAELAGLTALGHAVSGFDNAVNERASGGYGAAGQSLQTAVAALQSGSAEMATATVDANRYRTK